MGFVEFHNVKDFLIWDKFRQGNVNAFEIIYERNINILANYGNRMCQDEELVKDAVQDVFVDLWRNKSNLGPTDSIKFYLLKAFRRNLVKKIVRCKKYDSHDSIYQTYQGAFDLAHDDSIIAAEIEKTKLSELNKQLNNLAPRQKEALFLRFFTGLNYTEISKTMGINQQSAYNMVFRALKLLRDRISMTISSLLLFLISTLNYFFTFQG